MDELPSADEVYAIMKKRHEKRLFDIRSSLRKQFDDYAGSGTNSDNLVLRIEGEGKEVQEVIQTMTALGWTSRHVDNDPDHMSYYELKVKERQPLYD